MHVVIAGAGEVGRHITQALRKDEHEIVLIDVDPEACQAAQDLDCMVIEGHAGSGKVLESAGIANAEIFYAVTSQDEVNLTAAAVAKSKGAENVYARVNSMSLLDEAESADFDAIGVDIAVSPDLVAAEKLRRLIEFPGLLEIDAFDVGNLRVIETRVESGSPALGSLVRDLDLPEGANLVSLFRGAEVRIPRGDDQLMEGDRAVLVLGGEGLMDGVRRVFGERTSVREERGSPNHVVISGSSGVAKRLAGMLQEAGRRVTMIAQSEDRSEIEALAADMEGVLVLEGSSRDVRVFREESLDEADAVVAASELEEYNIITALLARSLDVPRTMALVGQPELETLAERLGVDAAVSPRLTAASTFLKRASGLDPEEMALVHQGQAQVLIADVEEGDAIAGKRLADAGLPRGSVVGAILRNGESIVPRGPERIEVGDSVVVFATSDTAPKLSDFL